jgi:hypothetical protein
VTVVAPPCTDDAGTNVINWIVLASTWIWNGGVGIGAPFTSTTGGLAKFRQFGDAHRRGERQVDERLIHVRAFGEEAHLSDGEPVRQ